MRVLIVLPLLAACAAEPQATPKRGKVVTKAELERLVERGDDSCGAYDYEGLVGTKLAAVTLPADLGARIIGPDTAVTQDYRPDRLNIHTGEDGTITELTCG